MHACNVDGEEGSTRSLHPNPKEELMRDLKCNAIISIVANDMEGSTTLAVKPSEGDGAMTSRNANEERGSMTSRNFENKGQLTSLGFYARRIWVPLERNEEASSNSKP